MSLNLKKNLVEEFNQRIYKSTIKTKKYPCLCGGAEIRKLWSWDRFGFWNPVGICKQCGLIQINPRLTEEEYGKFYSSDDYRLLYGGDEYLEEAETRYGRKVSEEIFEHLRPIMEERGLKTVVEVGCG